MRITLKQLAVFKAICDNRQLSKAARQLHLSVPAVSMNLKELESSLEAKLLERTPHGLVLTDAGNLALQQANTILKQTQHLEQMFKEQAKGLGGSLSIGANKTSGNYVLSRKLPRFKALYPSVSTRLKIDSSALVEEMVHRNELDMAFIGQKPKDKNIHYQRWRNDRLCVVAAPGHKLAHRPATPADLTAATWILDEEDSATRIESLNLLKELGVTVQDEIIMNTMGAIKRAVGTGLGLSILPMLAVDAELERGDLKEVQTGATIPDRDIYVIYKETQRTPLMERFLDCCGLPVSE
ncbi:transcriptional regulator, LysR family [Ferrimonas balearica DSM 9799]|uniref:Transcriptional regulator, LysR family n=1 Tax=Ferrimonas balearica (strain DSM 9799 / CCM 4581 / KCTC 23876 / PAT) TaxID=550540 RepID=E1SWI2_FERBD|nr:LysR family transcriptional regulator [Ferrimonas balearica]ADN76464.1 transcriptional regulator, LysR family [Ferrimonas balearica DSM 9799]